MAPDAARCAPTQPRRKRVRHPSHVPWRADDHRSTGASARALYARRRNREPAPSPASRDSRCRPARPALAAGVPRRHTRPRSRRAREPSVSRPQWRAARRAPRATFWVSGVKPSPGLAPGAVVQPDRQGTAGPTTRAAGHGDASFACLYRTGSHQAAGLRSARPRPLRAIRPHKGRSWRSQTRASDTTKNRFLFAPNMRCGLVVRPPSGTAPHQARERVSDRHVHHETICPAPVSLPAIQLHSASQRLAHPSYM